VNKVPVREDLPGFIQAMLASGGALPDGDDWAFEVKWDGARAQVCCDGNALSIRSRSGRSIGEKFPELRALLDPLRGRRVVLDGELVCLASDGMPDFAPFARVWAAGVGFRAQLLASASRPR
jgi:bifunctional non-homologous end joining protein LigD